MGLNSFFQGFKKPKTPVETPADQVAKLETAREEITMHVEAGNGVKEDAKRLAQIESTLAGLKAKMGVPSQKSEDLPPNRLGTANGISRLT